jgi:hypothetical protein
MVGVHSLLGSLHRKIVTYHPEKEEKVALPFTSAESFWLQVHCNQKIFLDLHGTA